MICQHLYDAREVTGFCSGTDLHRFFRDEVGELSPSGRLEISEENSEKFLTNCFITLIANNSLEWFKKTVQEPAIKSNDPYMHSAVIRAMRKAIDEAKARWAHKLLT